MSKRHEGDSGAGCKELESTGFVSPAGGLFGPPRDVLHAASLVSWARSRSSLSRMNLVRHGAQRLSARSKGGGRKGTRSVSSRTGNVEAVAEAATISVSPRSSFKVQSVPGESRQAWRAEAIGEVERGRSKGDTFSVVADRERRSRSGGLDY